MSIADPTPPLTAAVLAIGDEVLRGEIVNSNAAVLADRLFALGVEPLEHLVVSDEPPAMKAAIERLTQAHDVLVVTGGLGPTDDDRTVDVVAAMLGTGRVVHQPSFEAMKARFDRQGFRLTPNNMRQVEIPEGAEPLGNGVGLAPGFCVRLGDAIAFFMPGVPREMMRIFVDHVAPRIADLVRQRGGLVPATRTFHVYGMGESHVDDRLAGLVADVPDVRLHFRAAMTETHVRLVVRNRAPEDAQAVLDRLGADLCSRLGLAVYGSDDDNFVLAVQRTFRAARKTLALAESCTGGYAGELATSEPGASAFFVGGVVSYANEVKTGVLGVDPATLRRHGAVSEPCAIEMAAGARRVLAADIAVSITGIAGDTLDSPASAHSFSPGYPQPVDKSGGGGAGPATPPITDKPVGTVCFGVCHPGGVYSETRVFSGGRDRIRRAASYFALDLARRAVLGILPTQKPSKI